ncbi:MAG: MBL fold metallo-hydrolase [Cephaloticoccus sp.]
MHPPCTLHRVTDHVWWFTPESRRDRPSLAVVVGARESLLLDVGASPAHLGECLSAVAAAGLRPPSRAVLSHAHWDHVFGIEAFPGEVVAHRLTAAQLARMRTWDYSDAGLPALVANGREIAFTAEYIPRELTDAQRRTLKLRLPDTVLEETWTADLGGVAVHAHPVGGDHAADAVVIHVPGDGLVFLGDCLCDDLWAPVRRYTRSRFLPLLAQLEQLAPATMIEGHNPDLFTDKELAALIEVVGDAYSVFDRIEASDAAAVRADLTTRHAASLVDDILPPILAGLDQP